MTTEVTQTNLPDTQIISETNPTPKIVTEDLGKIFEKAICECFNISYNGSYKYTDQENQDKCAAIKLKIQNLRKLAPPGRQISHSAANKSRYDFTFTPTVESKILLHSNSTPSISNQYNNLSLDGTEKPDSTEQYWSAKTSKQKNGRIAPQVIGQTTPDNFCSIVGCGNLTIDELKRYIQSADKMPGILQLLFEYTFSCPIIYYNEVLDDIKYIKASTPINWPAFLYKWTRSDTNWTNSTTLRIKKNDTDKFISILEIQFHTKSRSNMAIRWHFENLLKFFESHFEIIQIHKKIKQNENTGINEIDQLVSKLTI